MFESVTYRNLNNLKQQIQDALAAKKIDNTGEVSNSLEISGAQLLAYDYIYYLDKGRGPGKFPPPQNLIAWVKTKLGIEDSQAKAITFLVGRKISNLGTTIFNDKTKGLELDNLVDNMLEDIQKEVAEDAKVEVLKWL